MVDRAGIEMYSGCLALGVINYSHPSEASHVCIMLLVFRGGIFLVPRLSIVDCKDQVKLWRGHISGMIVSLHGVALECKSSRREELSN